MTKSPWKKALIWAGIQATGGALLAVYTYKSSNSFIGPFMGSGIAVVGAYEVFEILWKRPIKEGSRVTLPYALENPGQLASAFLTGLIDNMKSKEEEIENIAAFSLSCFAAVLLHIGCKEAMKIFWRLPPIEKKAMTQLVIGTVVYSTTVYACSEVCKCNDKLWMPCIGAIASGYCIAVSAMKSLETVFNRNPFLKCCQCLFEPAFIAYAATYVLHSQNNEEKKLYSSLLHIVIHASGLTNTLGLTWVYIVIGASELTNLLDPTW